MNFNVKYQGSNYSISADYKKGGKALLLLLHGLGCTKESFKDIWNRKEFDDYSILAIDILGFGDSAKPQDFSYLLEDQATLIKSLLDLLVSHDNILVVGHSMGGSIGLLLTEMLGNKVEAFINLEGNLVSEDCGLLSRKTTSVSLNEFKNHVFDELREKFKTSPHKASQIWAAWSEKADPLAFYRSAASLVQWSDSGILLEKFLKLPAKKYYLSGDREKQTLRKGKMFERLKHIPLIEIPNSGHFMMNDNPEDFYRILGETIKR